MNNFMSVGLAICFLILSRRVWLACIMCIINRPIYKALSKEEGFPSFIRNTADLYGEQAYIVEKQAPIKRKVINDNEKTVLQKPILAISKTFTVYIVDYQCPGKRKNLGDFPPVPGFLFCFAFFSARSFSSLANCFSSLCWLFLFPFPIFLKVGLSLLEHQHILEYFPRYNLNRHKQFFDSAEH